MQTAQPGYQTNLGRHQPLLKGQMVSIRRQHSESGIQCSCTVKEIVSLVRAVSPVVGSLSSEPGRPVVTSARPRLPP
jgi:hypothetical protein